MSPPGIPSRYVTTQKYREVTYLGFANVRMMDKGEYKVCWSVETRNPETNFRFYDITVGKMIVYGPDFRDFGGFEYPKGSGVILPVEVPESARACTSYSIAFSCCTVNFQLYQFRFFFQRDGFPALCPVFRS